jgi:hypothetical protein
MPAPIALDMYQEEFLHLPSKYANITSGLIRKKRCLFHVLFLNLRQTCPISHFMHRNTTAVYTHFCRILHDGQFHDL